MAAVLGFVTSVALANAPRVLFFAGKGSHGFYRHEYNAGSILLATALNRSGLGLRAEVFHAARGTEWPSEEQFKDVAAVILFCDGGPGNPFRRHVGELGALHARGVGIGLLHWALGVETPEATAAVVGWVGFFYEPGRSAAPVWKPRFVNLPEHPVTRGVGPFAIQDEWYINLSNGGRPPDIVPILTAVPPQNLLPEAGPPHLSAAPARDAVRRGDVQTLMWVKESQGGGRGFGFTGAHFHDNWQDDDFRKIVLNAVVWLARLEVPAGGVASPTPSNDELLLNQDEPVDPRRFRTSR